MLNEIVAKHLRVVDSYFAKKIDPSRRQITERMEAICADSRRQIDKDLKDKLDPVLGVPSDVVQ